MAHKESTILIGIKELLASKPQISLPEISLALGIERHTIEKVVSHVSHVSFRTWRRAVLMGTAAERLSDSPALSTAQLARDFGYGSARAFSRAFKETIGISVGEFRRNR